MLTNYLIGLHEGVEAALVVGAFSGYLVRTGDRGGLPSVWSGTGVAVAFSLGSALVLRFVPARAQFTAVEAFGGTMSVLAAALVTWLVFRMRRASRQELAAPGNSAFAAAAFAVTSREGPGTALFLGSTIRATGTTAAPVTGAVLGLASAVALGYLLYSCAARPSSTRVRTWAGAALLVLIAGMLTHGVHDLQEAGWLPGMQAVAFDMSAAIPPASWHGALLRGVFNVRPSLTWVEVVAWLAYLLPAMYLFLRPVKSGVPAAQPPGRDRSGPAPAGSPPRSSPS